MKHPTPEELVQYMYGETESAGRRSVKTHLEACAECRERIGSWRAVGGQLDAWSLKRPVSSPVALFSKLRWAAGALALMALCTLAFAFGRASGRGDLAAIRSSLEPQLRRDLQAEFGTALKAELTSAQAEHLKLASEETQRLIAQVELRRSAELRDLYAALLRLKREVDTVAVNADASLRSTEEQLIQLVSVQRVGATDSEKMKN